MKPTGLPADMVIYETVRRIDGVPVDKDAHLRRIAGPLRRLGREHQLPEIALGLEHGGPDEAVVVESTSVGLRWVRKPFDFARVGRPVDVQVSAVVPLLVSPRYKHRARGPWELRRAELGVSEVIWVREGRMLEASLSNVIAIRDGVLWTAPADGSILPGVTRAKVVRVARGMGIRVVLEAPRVEDRWDGLYLCSSLKVLAPAVLGGRASESRIGERLLGVLWGSEFRWRA